jgi:hypothetical protein
VQAAQVLPIEIHRATQLLIHRLRTSPSKPLDDRALFPLRNRCTLQLVLALVTQHLQLPLEESCLFLQLQLLALLTHEDDTVSRFHGSVEQ